MKWGVLLFLVAVAGAGALAEDVHLTFPELVRGQGPVSRIVAGWPAAPGQIPYQVSLRMVSVAGGVFGCGASLIHNEWALTAAHCTANRPTIVIRIGMENVTTPAIIVESTEYYNHPLYNEAIAGIVQPNDIGLLKIPIWVEYNGKHQFDNIIKPVRIQRSWDMNKNYDGLQLVAAGWGHTWTGGPSAEHMNWVFLRGISNFECLVSFGGSAIIQPSTICTRGFNNTAQSTCQGDSGGSLTHTGEDGIPTLVGVTSFVASAGCHVGMPAGFIRPGFYHGWYTEVTGINFDWYEWTTTTEAAETTVPSTTAAPEIETTQTPEDETTQEPDDKTTQTTHIDTSTTQSPDVTTTQEPDGETTQTADIDTSTTQSPDVTTTQEPDGETTPTTDIDTTQTPEVDTTSTLEPEIETTQAPDIETTQTPDEEDSNEPSGEDTDESSDSSESDSNSSESSNSSEDSSD